VVNRKNPVTRVSLTELQGVFSGNLRSWRDIGGSGETISLFSRDDKSGTFDTFSSLVLKGQPLHASARIEASNRSLAKAVADDGNGVGFVAFTAVGGAKSLSIVPFGNLSIAPTLQTVSTEAYPLARRLYLYAPTTPYNAWKTAFLDFVDSPEAQSVVEIVGFASLRIKAFPPPADSAALNATGTDAARYFEAVKTGRLLSLSLGFTEGSMMDSRTYRDVPRLLSFLKREKGSFSRIVLVGLHDPGKEDKETLQAARRRAVVIGEMLKNEGFTSVDYEFLTVSKYKGHNRAEIWLVP
jgi:phosphate transport system substrate-binding protein